MNRYQYVVGRFLPKTKKFKTVDGEIDLFSSLAEEEKEVFEAEVPDWESFALLKGVLVGGQLFDTQLIEKLPTLASNLLLDYLDKGLISRAELESRVLFLLEGILGPIEQAPGPDEVVPSGPKPKVALVVSGEWDYELELADLISKQVKLVELKIFSEPDMMTPDLPKRINTFDPSIAIVLRYDLEESEKSGSKVMHHYRSRVGGGVAAALQEKFAKILDVPVLPVEKIEADSPLYTLVNYTKAPIVLAQPFNSNNASDVQVGGGSRFSLAEGLAEFIDLEATGRETVEPSNDEMAAVFEEPKEGESISLVWQNLTKERFLEQNIGAIQRIIDESNEWQQGRQSSPVCAVTMEDFWAVTYSEMGLTSKGKVNPFNKHSLGEYGLLPLPKNLRDWAGSDAPHWTAVIPLVENISWFTRYLAILKNQKLASGAGFDLYPDCFRYDGISGSPVREARLLAAVVHGYFYSGAYNHPRHVPIERILKGITSDLTIPEIMNSTTYKHVGTGILESREKNIVLALGLLGSDGINGGIVSAGQSNDGGLDSGSEEAGEEQIDDQPTELTVDTPKVIANPLTVSNHFVGGVKRDMLKYGGTIVPRYLVIHNTEGGKLNGSISHLRKMGYAYHLMIERTGEIVQCAPLNKRTSHAGASNWKDTSSLNNHSIGISLANWGPLEKVGNIWVKKWVWEKDRSRFDFTDEDVLIEDHKNGINTGFAWEYYTEQQLESLHRLCDVLCKSYAIENILGHDDIAIKRKSDPGPALKLPQFRGYIRSNRLLMDRRRHYHKVIRVRANDTLNVRKAPSFTGAVVDELRPDERVFVLSRCYQGGSALIDWLSVSRDGVTHLGYVKRRYLQQVYDTPEFPSGDDGSVKPEDFS